MKEGILYGVKGLDLGNQLGAMIGKNEGVGKGNLESEGSLRFWKEEEEDLEGWGFRVSQPRGREREEG